jgi:heme-degrading monooxygenase HmoA
MHALDVVKNVHMECNQQNWERKATRDEPWGGSQGVPARPGNKGVYVLHRDDRGETESVVLSLWDSLASIKPFAGNEIEFATYYMRDREFLVDLEPHVAYYEVAEYEPQVVLRWWHRIRGLRRLSGAETKCIRE